MQSIEVPSVFYPSSVLFIDDNKRFLDHLSLQFDDSLNYKFFEQPVQALEYLQGDSSEVFSFREIVFDNVERNSCERGHHSANIDLNSIHQQVYNHQRFNAVSVVVVDYSMPGMDGIEFCKRLTETSIKKILLTGEGDHHLGVDAFNAGLIDQFFLKSQTNFHQKLIQSILEMRQRYFLNITNGITSFFLNDALYCLSNPRVIEVFKRLCEEHAIVEYYLFDASGTLLLLNKEGEIFWFVVKSNLELNMYASLIEDEPINKNLYDQLTRGEKIPFFPDQPINHEWDTHLHPATLIEAGDISYYYAFLRNFSAARVYPEKIFSYLEYLSQ